jgi:hypothetical protein
MGRKLRSKHPEEANFGFFSEEAAGTGVDISCSEYDAFALLNGLRLAHRLHHISQQEMVERIEVLEKDRERRDAANFKTT